MLDREACIPSCGVNGRSSSICRYEPPPISPTPCATGVKRSLTPTRGRSSWIWGPRRVLPADAVGELILTHRASREAGGRCAVVVGPALAAQLSLAYPEGILWAATRSAAISALRTAQPHLRARVRTRGEAVPLHLAG